MGWLLSSVTSPVSYFNIQILFMSYVDETILSLPHARGQLECMAYTHL